MLGPKKCWVKRNIGSRENFGSKKNVGSKRNFDPKDFLGPNNVFVQNMFWVQKIFWVQVQKQFRVLIIFHPNIFWGPIKSSTTIVEDGPKLSKPNISKQSLGESSKSFWSLTLKTQV